MDDIHRTLGPLEPLLVNVLHLHHQRTLCGCLQKVGHDLDGQRHYIMVDHTPPTTDQLSGPAADLLQQFDTQCKGPTINLERKVVLRN